MKTFTLSLLLSILYFAAGAQCAAPVVTASGPTSFCPGGSVTLSAPTGNGNVWTQKADFGGVTREDGAIGFSIGSKGYIGTGYGGSNIYYKDFWEYDPATNAWTQKADFGGAAREGAAGFSIGSKGYIGTGRGGGGFYGDFWEYDPATNVWTKKADFGGAARSYGVGFSIGSKGYIGTGEDVGGNDYNDLWEYNPTSNVWTRKADFGGAGRFDAVGFSIGSKGYIGTGWTGRNYPFRDFWEYDPAINVWTQKSDFGGTARYGATGFSIGSKGYIGAGNISLLFSFVNDFWEYNPATDKWTQKADFGGAARYYATGFSIGSKGYVGIGSNASYQKDFWEYDPGYTYAWSPSGQTTSSISATTTGNYTVTTTNATGCSATSAATVVTVNTPVTPVITASGSTTLCPGSSVTLSAPTGNVWTQKADFGGAAREGSVGFSIGTKGYIGTGRTASAYAIKDFWEYDPATNVWTQKADFGGGERSLAIGFSIGGKGYAGTGQNNNHLAFGDFWEYDPVTNVWTKRADVGGGARIGGTGFSIGNKGYIGTGFTNRDTYSNDFWEYDPATNVWTGKADFSGVGRAYATGFSISNKGYLGTGLNFVGSSMKDFWEYNPATNVWAQKANFGGTARNSAVGFSIGSKGYIGSGNSKDIWEYNPATNLWTQKPDIGGNNKISGVGFSIGSKGYIGTGYYGSYNSDFWEYDPGYTYSWNPGGQTTSSIMATASGNYMVTTTNATGCSATSAATAVTVNPVPATPVITASGSTSICSGSSVTLTSSSATTYQWYLNGAAISGAVSQSYSASAAGSYTVSVTNASGCGATSVATVVTVNTIITPVINAPGGTVICPGSSVTLSAPAGNAWAQKADFGGSTKKGYAAGFCIGNKGYVGTGWDVNSNNTKDFWEYDPSTNVWTQKADFGGVARHGATGFSIGSKGYVGLGLGSDFYNDFWEYDPATNIWMRKADFGGETRRGAIGFSIGAKGYMGMGSNSTGNYTKDFWEYNPATNTWTQKADFGGLAKYRATGFSTGSKGYVGTGLNSNGYTKDFWEYDPSANIWTQKADFGGAARGYASGFSIGGKGYIGTGLNGTNYYKDFWEYNPATNTWTQKADFGGDARESATAFAIGGKGYVGTGVGSSGYTKDFWEYDPGYTYAWSPGNQTTSSITVTSYGNYTVTTTNAFGCSATSAVTKVTAYSSTVLYVDSSKTVSGDGSSWANAYKEVREALYAASQCSNITTINVAKGTYKPTDDTNRDSAFTIYRGGLKIYGGYPSGGGTRNSAANLTILSGDIGTANNTSDNSFHVVVVAGVANGADSLVLDGFNVSGGNANRTINKTYNGASLYQGDGAGVYLANNGTGGKTAIRNCIVANNFANNNGGGIYNASSSPVIINCVFASNSGGGMYNGFSSPSLTNCVFVSNSAVGNGGAMVNVNSSPVVTNCTFTLNTTTGNGTIFSQNPSSPQFTNCIIWGNTASAGNVGFQNTISTPSVTYSDVEGSYGGTGNISSDPLFVNSSDADGADNIFGTADDGLKLRLGSPAGSTGNNAGVPAGITTDITGAARIQGGTVDMGAYESPSCPSSQTLYVDGSRAVSGDGTSWANAYKELRDALYIAGRCSNVTTINVAKGTYKPIDYANPDSAFVIYRGGLKMYGGYPTGGGARNAGANPTILSGEIGTAATTDNSYHILVIAGLPNTADSVVIDGFTLTAGNAAGTGSVVYNGISLARNHGAAIDAEQNASGKLAFRNLIINNNAGGDGWGSSLVLTSSNAVVEKCIFYSNSTSGTGQGGAMWNNGSTTTVNNSLFYNNYGAALGGAVQLNGGNPLSIINSTFYANRTGGNGAAIRSGAGSVLNVGNTIFYKNDIGAQNGSYVAPGNDLTLVGSYTITNSMLQGAAAGYLNTANSVFGDNPLFVNEANPAGGDNIFGTADDGFHLQGGSPAQNGGNNASVPSGITTDLANAARIQDGIVDMGAYEGSPCSSFATLYVDSSITASGNGGSWATAFRTLQQALNVANSCPVVKQVWIKKGTYYPTSYPFNCTDCATNSTARDYTFALRDGLALYGGFAGTETDTAQRVAGNTTILSGDIGTPNDNSDNCYHVLFGINGSNKLSGFTVTGGNANDNGTITVAGQTIYRSNGGGMYQYTSSANLYNCTFSNNTAKTEGGGVYNVYGSTLRINKSGFLDNHSGSGGAVRLLFGNASLVSLNSVYAGNTASANDAGALSLVMGSGTDTLINNVFVRNVASGNPGGNGGGALVQESGTSTYIVNNTFYADSASSNAGAIWFKSGGSNRFVYNNIFYKNYNGTANTDISLDGISTVTAQSNNLYSTTNPLFVNESNPAGADHVYRTSDDGLNLQLASPGVNTGSNAAVPAGITTDIAGAARIQNSIVDIGAYENSICPSFTTLYVDKSVASSGDGSSWATALKEVRDALAITTRCTGITTINVAKGTYLPTSDANRDSSFTLYRGGLKIYGGYPTGGGARNSTANPTLLSGDIGTVNDSTDNSYHVIVIANPGSNADSLILDGFTIIKGNAGSNASTYKIYNGITVGQFFGGGIYAGNQVNGKTAIRNCFITNNTAGNGGGLRNNGGASPSLINCTFSYNNAPGGGGISNDNCLSLIQGCNFIGNNAAQYGGGILNWIGTSVTIDSCTFSFNTSATGAGVYSYGGTQPVSRSTFTSNKSTGEGGAIYHTSGGKLILTKCVFQGNSAASGGAVRLLYGDPSFTAMGNTFYQNIASSNDGGALSLVTGNGKDTLINNLFVQNKASGNPASNGGGALVQENGISSYIVNNTFYADSAASNGGAIRFKNSGSNRYVYNNIFYKNYNGTSNTDISLESGTTITAQSNNLYSDVNPLFINEANPAGSDNLFGTSDDGLKLMIGSPAQNTGSNMAIPAGITTDIKGDARIFNCTVDMGAYEVADNLNTYWTGLVSNDWSVAGNWCGSVPGNGASVVIPVSAPYPPRLSSPVTVNNLMIATGTSISLNGNALTLTGTINGTGVITSSPLSSLVINGSGDAGTLYFDPSADGTTNALRDMTVNRTSGIVTLGNKLNLTGTYTPTAGVLNSNGYLNLKSNASGTASVAQGAASGGYITGNVTAERYTDGGAPGVGRRAWRLLSSPVTGTTIYDGWQESGVTTNGYGTLITGEGLTPAQASAEGFDYIGGGNHTSIKQYDSIGNAWVPLSTNSTLGTKIPLRSHLAYMVFVRGNRTVNSTTGKSPATLRALGTLLQGTQTVALSPGSFTLAGNPYASSLDFGNLYSHNSALLQNQFSVWNSTLGVYGAYVLVKRNAANTAYEATPAPMNVSRPDEYKYIPGGSGFFLYPLAGITSGNVTIRETDKASGTPPVSPFREVSPAVKELRVNLNLKDSDTSLTLADGFLVQFDDAFTDTAAQKDASGVKAANFNENLAVVRSGTNFIVDARQNVQPSDTVFMKLWYVSKRNYRFQVKADNFTTSPGMQAWLEDSYLGTKQALSLSGNITTIDFTVTNDSLSWQSNRFRIVFRNQALTSLPVTLTNVTAAPQNGGVNVSWTVSNEVNIKGYTVERSADGGRTYADIAVQLAKSGGSSASYSSYDAKPNTGDNLYRIKIEANDAKVSYSGSVKVTIGERLGIAMTVYPNPATTRATVHIDNLTDDMSIVLTDGKGNVVWKKENVVSSDTSIPVAQLANGSYLVTIKTKNDVLKTLKLVKAD